jgi:hypothetical protein
MTVKEIKNLPDEFDYVYRINPYGTLYHAVKKKHCYEVTCEYRGFKYKESYAKEKFIRMLFEDEFIIK